MPAKVIFFVLKSNHRHEILGSVPDYKKLIVSYKMEFCIATRSLDKIFFCTQKETFRIVTHHIQIHPVNILSFV